MSINSNIDIVSQMLSALTSEPEDSIDQHDDDSAASSAIISAASSLTSIEEQKRYLRMNINSVSVEDRRGIGDVLLMNNKKDALKPCAEGTVINLDNLSAHIIGQMYNLLVYKRGM